jgi:hypothetical protein
MSTLLARTGRHRQRYVDQFRLVAGYENFFFKSVSSFILILIFCFGLTFFCA